MDATANLYQVGGVVVHAKHGPSHITAIESEVITGTEYQILRLTYPRKQLALSVPLTGTGIRDVRPLTPEVTLRAAIKQISAGRMRTGPKAWNQRSARLLEQLNSGDINQLASVVGELYPKPDATEPPAGQTIYQEALDRLVQEISLVRSCSEAEAVAYLEELCPGKTFRLDRLYFGAAVAASPKPVRRGFMKKIAEPAAESDESDEAVPNSLPKLMPRGGAPRKPRRVRLQEVESDRPTRTVSDRYEE